ncbi:MAG: hypothetical protein E7211_18955 [Clostridium lundense]|jgi:hypothetical protein|nr:hypothetical protein [Clostridium lundense]
MTGYDDETEVVEGSLQEWVYNELTDIKADDPDYATKVNSLASLYKAVNDRSRIEIDQANEARKDRNERLRSIATIAGAAGGILIAGLNFALGLRATKKEEDYEHVNREGMNAATRGLSGLNGLFRK